jgi:peptidoglycan DL-endopeptidase CwlO
MSRRYRPIGAFILVVAATIGLVTIAGPAVAETDYPSWQDVQAAKHDQAAKQAEIAKISALISGLETEAAAFAKVSLEKGEEYNQAVEARDTAKVKADSLSERAAAAKRVAKDSGARAGELVAQLSRLGGNDVVIQLLVSESNADDLLYKIGAMDKLTEQAARIYDQAKLDLNLAKSLSREAAAASGAYTTLADKAKLALDEAQQAAQDAEARVASQKVIATTLYAQLGSLKGTTASTEQAYADGLAWEAAQNAIKNPPPPPPPLNPTPAPPSAGAVAGAIAFARAQVGDTYQLNGSGPDAWDCSGLTRASYASVGVYIGTHSATNQYATMAAAGRLVPFNEIAAGDLIFYSNGGTTSGTKYHVALYIGNGQMIEAPYPGVNVRVAPVRYGDLVPYAGRPTP